MPSTVSNTRTHKHEIIFEWLIYPFQFACNSSIFVHNKWAVQGKDERKKERTSVRSQILFYKRSWFVILLFLLFNGRVSERERPGLTCFRYRIWLFSINCMFFFMQVHITIGSEKKKASSSIFPVCARTSSYCIRRTTNNMN